jgi:uncharacterized protein YkwD
MIALFLVGGCKVKSRMTEAEAEQEVFRLVNQYRESLGLNQLEWSDVIAEQCRIHSQNMASGAIGFNHEGFDQRIAAIDAVIPYRFSAENLAKIADFDNPAQIAMESWLKSQGHKENIEDNFDMTGVGVAIEGDSTFYFTQIFILRK